MPSLRDSLRRQLESQSIKVMVCGAAWDGTRSAKRREIAEKVAQIQNVGEVVVPELDPAPRGIAGALDENMLADDCEVIIVLIEPEERSKGAADEAITFAGRPDFYKKGFVLVPPRLHQVVTDRVGYWGHSLGSHPTMYRFHYQDDDYHSCAVTVRCVAFVENRLSILTNELYEQSRLG